MSFAAWIPSSLRFFSICLLRAREARSSALMAQPMMMVRMGCRASLLRTWLGAHEWTMVIRSLGSGLRSAHCSLAALWMVTETGSRGALVSGTTLRALTSQWPLCQRSVCVSSLR